MSRMWKLAVPLAVVLAVGGYAASSLAASDLDAVTPRETIVIEDESAPSSQHDGRTQSGGKGEDRGDDGRTTDGSEDDVVPADVDDLDDGAGDDEGDDEGHDD